MQKKALSLMLALVMVLTLAAPASASTFSNGISVSDPSKHLALAYLPITLQRPIKPTSVEQLGDFAPKEENWIREQSRESVFQEIVALTDSLTAGKTTDKEKMKAIFDWVAENIAYDVTNLSYRQLMFAGNHLTEEQWDYQFYAATPLNIFVTRRAICSGYSAMCQLMGTLAGIPVADIYGLPNPEGTTIRSAHAWNAALLDGKWVFFDACWKLWDMTPDYHAFSGDIHYFDGVFDMTWAPAGPDDDFEDYMRMYIRPGFEDQCPAHVDIPEGMVTVYFQGCPTLKSVSFPASMTSINSAAFTQCPALESFTIPDHITRIEAQAFNQCTGLRSVTIPNSVTTIENGAFMGCTSLKSITIPGSVTSLGAGDGGTFYGCTALEDVTIQEGVTEIGSHTFMDCTALKTVTIPGSVATIGKQAFYGCTALETVNISEGVTTIEDMAFFGCANLRRADLPDSLTSLGNGVFTGCPKLESLTVPASMTSIGIGAFQGRTDLESFVIPDHITEICDRAFYDCTNLKSVTIPDSVTIIRYAAFRGCTSLESVTIPSSVTIIEHEVFAGCTGLTSMTIPEGVTTIGGSATPYTLESITIPTSVTSIGNGIFGGRMKDVYYAGTEEQWKAISLGERSLVERVTVHYNSTGPETTAAPTVPTAYASTQTVLVDGKKAEFQCYALKDANGNDTNYIKLRDIASILNDTTAQFEVGWNGAVNIETGKAYTSNGSEMSTPFSGNRAYENAGAATSINGAPVELEAIVLKDDKGGAYTYYKLRDLGSALGFKVDWSAEKGIFIETK